MSKIFKSLKGLGSAFALAALALGGYSTTANAASLPVDGIIAVNIGLSGNERYDFTPASDGILSMTMGLGQNLSLNGVDFILYEDGGKGVPFDSYVKYDGPSWLIIESCTWKLKKGQPYYFQYVDNLEEGKKCFFTFSGETGGGEGSVEWTEAVIGQKYTNPPFNLKFTADVAGDLTLTQSGYMLNQLFTDEACTSPALSSSIPLESPATYEYRLSPGTYYYQSYNGATDVTFDSWTPVSGGGEATGGLTWAPVEMLNLYQIPDGSELGLTFTAESEGELVINQWGHSDRIVFTEKTTNHEDYDIMVDGGADLGTSEPYVMRYEIPSAGTYYIYAKHDNENYLEITQIQVVSFTGEVGGGDDNGGGESEDNNDAEAAGYMKMNLNQSYYTNGNGSLKLYYTAAQNGTLIVTQYGSYESHLWSDVPDPTEDGGVMTKIQNNLIGVSYSENADGSNTLKYVLDAGKTYYVYAKINSYDGLSEVTYQWQEEAQIDNVIELDQQTTVKNGEIFKFTAPATGTLNVNTNKYDMSVVWGSQQFVIYDNAGCSEGHELPQLGEPGDSSIGGYLIKVAVEEGETYYLTNHGSGSVVYLLTLDEGEVTGKLVRVEPNPGESYDFVNFMNTWNMIFAPSDVTVESLELTYEAKGKPAVTVTVPEGEYYMGAGVLRIETKTLNQLYDQNDVEPTITYNFHGVKSGNIVITEYAPENGDMKGVTMSGDGDIQVQFIVSKPITVVSENIPDPLYQTYKVGDAAAKATITFSGNVKKVDEVSVIQGHIVPGSQTGGDDAPPSVNVYNTSAGFEDTLDRVSINGNTITINFAGVDMSDLNAGEVTVWVSGIVGVNGLEPDCGGQAVFTAYPTLVATENPNPEEEMGYDTDEGISMVFEHHDFLFDNPEDAASGDPVSKNEVEDLNLFWGDSANRLPIEKVTEAPKLITVNGPSVKDESVNYSISSGNTLVVSIANLFAGLQGEEGSTGVYTISIPAETLRIAKAQQGIALYDAASQVYNDAKTLAMNVQIPTGVTIIASDADGLYRVYTINGVNVLNTENALDINNLVPGLYIINGKKVLVK